MTESKSFQFANQKKAKKGKEAKQTKEVVMLTINGHRRV
jgi:hypothetical protein